MDNVAVSTTKSGSSVSLDEVLVLTSAGKEEVDHPQHGLSLPERRLLTLIDGARSLGDLLAEAPTLPEQHLERYVMHLRSLALIEGDVTVAPAPSLNRGRAAGAAPATAQIKARSSAAARGKQLPLAWIAGPLVGAAVVAAGAIVFWPQSHPGPLASAPIPAPPASQPVAAPPAPVEQPAESSQPSQPSAPLPAAASSATTSTTEAPPANLAAAASESSPRPSPPVVAERERTPVEAVAAAKPVVPEVSTPRAAAGPERVALAPAPRAQPATPTEATAKTPPRNDPPAVPVQAPASHPPPASAGIAAAIAPSMVVAPAVPAPTPTPTPTPAISAAAPVAAAAPAATAQAAPARTAPAVPYVSAAEREFAPVNAAAADAGRQLVPEEKLPPIYPREAYFNGIHQGAVRARLTIGADGRVEKVDVAGVTPRDKIFERAAAVALATWRFAPGEAGRSYETRLEFRAP